MKELTFGVKELQARLSSVLRAVRSGTRVVVTSHDLPIAEISIPRKKAAKLSPQDRRRAQLIRRGILLPATRPGPIPALKPLQIGGLREQLEKDRR